MEVHDKIPVHLSDIILADSGKTKTKLWKEISSLGDYGKQAEVSNVPKYEDFKREILKRL